MAPFTIGQRVIVRAKGDFFAFIDGWDGTVSGCNNGLIAIKCQREDGEKTFFLPSDQLAAVLPK